MGANIMITPAPIHTLSPMRTSLPVLILLELRSSSPSGWPTETMEQWGPMLQRSPMTTSATGVSIIMQ